MTSKLPQRFDLVYANDKKDRNTTHYGYIIDIKEDQRKNLNYSGLVAYSPKTIWVKFLNMEMKAFSDQEVLNFINDKFWKTEPQDEVLPLDNGKARYGVGDLIFNKKNGKVSLVIDIVDTKDGKEDVEVKGHSRFWYKIQAPGNKQEPMSETFLENAIKKDVLEVHRKKVL